MDVEIFLKLSKLYVVERLLMYEFLSHIEKIIIWKELEW